MKTQKYLFEILFLSLMFAFAGCSFFTIDNGKDSDDRTNTIEQKEESSVPKTKIKFSVDGYDLEKSRTILPEQDKGDDIVAFVIEGLHTKNSSGVTLSDSRTEKLGEWATYEAMRNDVLEVLPGVWNFTIKCYKSEDGTRKLFATALIANKELQFTPDGGVPITFGFTLGYEDNELSKGSLSVKVVVPEGQLHHAEISLYNYQSGVKQNVTLSKTSYTSGANVTGTQAFNINESGIAKGYYFLEVKLFTDNSSKPTATRVEYVKIAGGQKSKAVLSYNNLNLRYTVTYHSQLADGEGVTMPADFTYNSSTNITLPTAATVVADHYIFTGWYEDSGYTGSPIANWSAGDRTEAVDLYAKFEPKNYDVNLYDYKGNQSTEKAFSGVTIATLDYDEAIPDPTLVPALVFESDDEVSFGGWYYDAACTADKKVTKITADTLKNNPMSGNEEIYLYAKWIPKNIYVSASGDNTNNGLTKTSPLQTIQEAKAYLSNKTASVRILSTLNVDSDANNPSGISSKALYGDGTNAVIIQRWVTDEALFKITGTGSVIEFSNVIIDGGTSSVNGPLIIVKGSTTFTLGGNTILQNNKNTAGIGGLGGAVYVENNGILSGTGGNNLIKGNSAGKGGGVYLETSSILNLKGTDFTDNVATGNGGAIYCATDAATSYSYIADVVLKNNQAADGEDIFIDLGASLQLDNCRLETKYASGSYNVYCNGELYLSGTTGICNTYLAAGSFIWPRDYFKSAGGIKHDGSENVLKTSFKKSKAVTTITLNQTLPGSKYIPADPTTYIQVLKEDAGTASIEAHHKKIISDTAGRTINNEGRLIYDPLSLMDVNFDIEFPSYDTNEITITSSLSGDTLAASTDTGYASYVWIFNGSEVTGQTTESMTLDVSGYNAGFYELIVIATDAQGQVDMGIKNIEIKRTLNAGGL